MTGCVLLLCFGLTVLLGGGAGQAAPSGSMALFAGVMAGLLPLVVGAPRRPDVHPGPRRSRRDEPGPGRPLLLINIAQGAALAVVLIGAAVLG
ncbi:hypothetical protein [Micromonospora sp. NPDC048830]|uniref:hypothetical protein n=1 Tax=Micromonospora sp. NPDC048830 TaxID=3364257 RepID=UPI003722782F